MAYLDEHAFITPDQFAYLKGHSTQTSLQRVIDHWLKIMNESQITGICMLDIAKCFDGIDHDLLLKKLSLCGIENVELEWFNSYLHQRQQAVLCNTQLLYSVYRIMLHGLYLATLITSTSIELVKSLGLYTIEERRDYFLAPLMFKSIHGLAPAYLCTQNGCELWRKLLWYRGYWHHECILTQIKERHLQE